MIRILVFFAGCFALLWATSRWRQALEAALVMLVIEGAVRKWLLPGAQDLVYFAKDALLIGVYVGFWRERSRLRMRMEVPTAITLPLALAAAFGALQIFNPALPNVLVGILGFKAYFLYVPLLWVVPAAFRTDRELARFLKRYVLLAIPVGLLAVAQFRSGSDSALNVYARGNTTEITTFGSSTQVRVTGTFSYITGYSSYVLTMVILVLAVLAATRWRLKFNWFTYASLLLTVLGMLMTGSRGPVFMLALLLPLYAWLGLASGTGASGLGRFLFGAGVVAMLTNYVGADAVQAFYGRASGATDLSSRLLAPVAQPLQALDRGGLLGYGIGATHQMAAAVAKSPVPYGWLEGSMVEGEPGQIMLELGPLGFLPIYFLRIFLVFYAAGMVMRVQTTFHRAMCTSCVLFFLAHLPGGVVFNITADVYYWFFVGLLFAIAHLDAAAAAPVAQPTFGRGWQDRQPPRPRFANPALPGPARSA